MMNTFCEYVATCVCKSIALKYSRCGETVNSVIGSFYPHPVFSRYKC